ncbi:MAG: sigma-70 family RNA polymerase sigma factor [Burkholderiales bacterium]|nr:sigma-70 family RNA polymerase sigma factor [Burkholderiales bacterium]
MAFDCVLGAWRAHEGELRGYILHRLGDPHAAEDLLQDVLLKAMRQGERFCVLENPRAWLFEVARNAIVDRARLAKAQVELPSTLAAETEGRAAVDALDACLARNLAELDPADRDIIERCDLGPMTVKAYAEARGLGLPAAKSRLLRARARLRARLVVNCRVRFDEAGRVCSHAALDAGA